MFCVLVNEGPLSAEDNAFYYSSVEPVFKAEIVSIEVSEGNTKEVVARYLEFTPNNGKNRGCVTRVPFERVVSISEDE